MFGHFPVTWTIAKNDCAKFHPNGKTKNDAQYLDLLALGCYTCVATS